MSTDSARITIRFSNTGQDHYQVVQLNGSTSQIPKPGKINAHQSNPDFEGWGWGMIDIDLTPYLGKAEKVTVTLPGMVIRQIDEYVTLHGIKSRSAFLSNAALEKIQHV
ncbi:hypothetical protein GLV89_06590 [Halomonas alkaliantarctica]|nr:hypothetical protein [Halomonas alkaliantarctica]